MKNKILIILAITLGIILIIFAGLYFLKPNKPADNSVSGGARENQKPEDNRPPENKMVTGDFEIALPAGWKQTAPAMGASAMAININEKLDDPAAQKINFKSYFAVSYDTLQKNGLADYLTTVKTALAQNIPGVIFSNEKDLSINGAPARALEAELTQQGVNFKILMVAVKGKADDVWVMSFNTIKSRWDAYQQGFSDIANSFMIKK